MNWSVITDNVDLFVAAAMTTIAIAGTTIVVSVILAFPLAVMRDLPFAPLRWFAATYSWITRATPSLVLLFLTYYGLPQVGIYFDAITAAIVGLTISAAGYNMEYIRAGLRSVSATQYEAARAIGMSLPLALRRVIVPQAMRVIVPPLTSNLTLLLKASALASLVAVTELTGQAMALISITYRPIEILTVVAIVYLILNSVLITAQKLVERRFSLPA